MLTPNNPAAPAASGTKPMLTLAAVVGPIAAAALLVLTPAEESGRKVEATIAADGSATVRHISGKQYLRAYLDAVGVPTICDGLTRGVRMGQQRSEAQCAAELEAELAQKALEVKRCAPSLWRPGTEQQRIAAVLLAYNIGSAGFCGSTARRLFEAGQIRKACDWFMPWNKGTFPAAQVPKARARGEICSRGAGGAWKCTMRGLTDRRARERAICLTGVK